MKKLLLTIFLSQTIILAVPGQASKRALFLGNSYTAAHNIPGMVADAALSAGDTLLWDSNTPGGYTLQGHSTDAGSLGLIAQGNWDFVVLQEQSQRPSFPIGQVQVEVFPYAAQLNSLINQHNSCAETVFYMTWGRKNGDAGNCAAWPPVCTYQGMDSLLRIRYMMMANDNEAVVSPVGAVWRHIRTAYPDIELYEPDESHPSTAGAYAVACSFYTTFFRKDPMLITWNSSLSANDALRIRTAAKAVVWDSLLTWHIGAYDPVADFSFQVTGDSVSFSNLSAYATQYHWDFGDGASSPLTNPVHQYLSNNAYTIQLIASHCGMSDTISNIVNITSIQIQNPNVDHHFLIFPNPVADLIHIEGEYTEACLFNAEGQWIRRTSPCESIPVRDLSRGIYFLQVSFSDGINIHKIVKKIVLSE
ncbi:MAG: PKD domain-containing protein [Bacteroidales bacterium]